MKHFTEYGPDEQAGIARTMCILANGTGNIEDWQQALKQLNPSLPGYPDYPAPFLEEVKQVVGEILAKKQGKS